MLGQMQSRLNHTVDDLKDAVARLENTRKSIKFENLKSLSLRPKKRTWPKALLLLGAVAALGAAAYAFWVRKESKPKDELANGTPHPDALPEKVGARDDHGF